MIFAIDAQDRAGRAALIDGTSSETWTFERLAEEVRQRRNALDCTGKALVFQFCRNTPDSVAWYLAAIEAGHAVALLAENLDAELRARLIGLFQPHFVLLPDCPGPEYDDAGPGLWLAGAALHPPSVHSDLALLLSTSGSTGSPKFVRLTRAAVEANARSIAEALEIAEGERPAAHLPMHYSYGLSVINSHLLTGAATILLNASLIAAPFWDAVSRHRASSLAGVPYTYQMLRRIRFEGLAAAESIVSMSQAGGKLDDPSILHFHEIMAARNGRFWVMYGQTEAVARIAILPWRDLPAKLGSAGLAIPGGSLAISAGELVYRGPNVMAGYATGPADLALGDELRGVLYTGDRAQLDREGYVRILGRVQRDAKIFGLRINMDEVEAMLKPYGPAGVVDGAGKLIVYCEFGDAAQLAGLHTEISAKLKLHKSALDFRRIDRLPTTGSGKTDYTQLAAS
jgi:acyl-coenzyme A synthetase/AMP-(fatty) acid ligase